MANLTFFTVTGVFTAVAGDNIYDSGADPDLVPITGSVRFTPMIGNADSLQADTLSPPTNLKLAPITARIKKGVVTTAASAGVRLPANSAVLNIDGDLFYKVEFLDLVARGERLEIEAFTLEAPATDVTVDLVDVARVAGSTVQGVVRGPRGFGVDLVTRVGNTLRSWVQGTQVGTVDISDLIFNGTFDSISDATTVGKSLGRAVTADDALGAITTTVGKAVGRAASKDAARFAAGFVFTRPAAFTFDWGFDIRFDGTRFVTDYDVAVRRNRSTSTLWVNTLWGSDTNGDGTPAKPYRTVAAAATAVAEGGTVMIGNAGLIFRSGFGVGQTITKSINIIAAHPGQTMFVQSDALTWTANATYPTTVWQASRTNVRKVVDVQLDPEGAELTRVADLATCNSTRGSWYQAADGTGPVYAHTVNNNAPNPATLFPLVSDNWLTFDASSHTGPMTVYLEGLRILGGTTGMTAKSGNSGGTSPRMSFTAKNCAFLHGGYGEIVSVDETWLSNGLNIVGNVDSYCQNVTIAHSATDGFNYHHYPYGGGLFDFKPNMVEIDCVAHDCGTDQLSTSLAVGATQNCSTLHEGIQGICIGGRYWKSYGSPISDVNTGTKRILLSCDVGYTTTTDTTVQTHSAIRASNSSSGTTEMWVFGCSTWGAQNGLYSAPGCTVHYDALASTTCTVARGGTGTFSLETN